jgi:phosphatidylinositol glycan class V
LKWDALFFIKISHDGYEFEKNHAFFPLFPLMIRSVARVLQPVLGFISQDELHLLAGVLISWGSFVMATVYMEK